MEDLHQKKKEILQMSVCKYSVKDQQSTSISIMGDNFHFITTGETVIMLIDKISTTPNSNCVSFYQC
jgi:hypothetical protein